MEKILEFDFSTLFGKNEDLSKKKDNSVVTRAVNTSIKKGLDDEQANHVDKNSVEYLEFLDFLKFNNLDQQLKKLQNENLENKQKIVKLIGYTSEASEYKKKIEEQNKSTAKSLLLFYLNSYHGCLITYQNKEEKKFIKVLINFVKAIDNLTSCLQFSIATFEGVLDKATMLTGIIKNVTDYIKINNISSNYIKKKKQQLSNLYDIYNKILIEYQKVNKECNNNHYLLIERNIKKYKEHCDMFINFNKNIQSSREEEIKKIKHDKEHGTEPQKLDTYTESKHSLECVAKATAALATPVALHAPSPAPTSAPASPPDGASHPAAGKTGDEAPAGASHSPAASPPASPASTRAAAPMPPLSPTPASAGAPPPAALTAPTASPPPGAVKAADTPLTAPAGEGASSHLPAAALTTASTASHAAAPKAASSPAAAPTASPTPASTATSTGAPPTKPILLPLPKAASSPAATPPPSPPAASAAGGEGGALGAGGVGGKASPQPTPTAPPQHLPPALPKAASTAAPTASPTPASTATSTGAPPTKPILLPLPKAASTATPTPTPADVDADVGKGRVVGKASPPPAAKATPPPLPKAASTATPTPTPAAVDARKSAGATVASQTKTTEKKKDSSSTEDLELKIKERKYTFCTYNCRTSIFDHDELKRKKASQLLQSMIIDFLKEQSISITSTTDIDESDNKELITEFYKSFEVANNAFFYTISPLYNMELFELGKITEEEIKIDNEPILNIYSSNLRSSSSSIESPDPYFLFSEKLLNIIMDYVKNINVEFKTELQLDTTPYKNNILIKPWWCNLCVFYYLSAVALNQIYNADTIDKYNKNTNFGMFPIIKKLEDLSKNYSIILLQGVTQNSLKFFLEYFDKQEFDLIFGYELVLNHGLVLSIALVPGSDLVILINKNIFKTEYTVLKIQSDNFVSAIAILLNNILILNCEITLTQDQQVDMKAGKEIKIIEELYKKIPDFNTSQYDKVICGASFNCNISSKIKDFNIMYPTNENTFKNTVDYFQKISDHKKIDEKRDLLLFRLSPYFIPDGIFTNEITQFSADDIKEGVTIFNKNSDNNVSATTLSDTLLSKSSAGGALTSTPSLNPTITKELIQENAPIANTIKHSFISSEITFYEIE